jgi:type I restriction enzyme, S subunit
MSSLHSDQYLPNGWRLARFDEFLTRVERKFIIDDVSFYDCVGVRWYGMGAFVRERLLGIDIARKQQWVVKAGDIVYNKLFAWKGSFAIADSTVDGCIVSDKFPTYKADLTKIDLQFLRYYFRTANLAQKAQDMSKGGAAISKLTLNPPQFWDLTIPLPPLEEQRRIVVRIEELAAKIEEARGLRQEAVGEEKILLSSAVTQVLRSIHSECEEVTVESIAHSVTDGDHQPPPKADSGIPFIFINHIIGGNIDFSGCKWVLPRYFASLPVNRVPKRGDVLYTAVGSYGVPCLVNTDEPFCFQRHIAIIKPNQNRIVPAYLTWALSSSDVFDQATKVATGSAQLTVPLRGIRNLKFTLPSLKEQQRIVAYLDNLKSKVDSLKQLQSETSVELNALLPSILDKAFKGEL